MGWTSRPTPRSTVSTQRWHASSPSRCRPRMSTSSSPATSRHCSPSSTTGCTPCLLVSSRPGTAQRSTYRSSPTGPPCTARRSGSASNTIPASSCEAVQPPRPPGRLPRPPGTTTPTSTPSASTGPTSGRRCASRVGSSRSPASSACRVVEVDRTQIHGLSQEALHAYASSDARLARVLAERRWASARRSIDRVPVRLAPPVDHARRLAAIEAARAEAAREAAAAARHEAEVSPLPGRARSAGVDPLADAG
jgi:hypothetical protein